jgi:hypothetical protein
MFREHSLTVLRDQHPDHPALTRFDAFKAVADRQAIRWPTDEPSVRVMARQMLDAAAWRPSGPNSDVWSLLPDDATRDFTLRHLRDPATFEDTMAELFYWGKLMGNGLAAVRREAEGHSDIAISEATPAEIRCEVKRLHEGTRPRRVGEVINTANKQIKRTHPDSAGVVFISLGHPLLTPAPDDGVPPEIERHCEIAYGATRGEINRSAGYVVLSWEEISVTEGSGGAIYFLIRNYAVVEHERPRSHIDIDVADLNAGQTLALVVARRR